MNTTLQTTPNELSSAESKWANNWTNVLLNVHGQSLESQGRVSNALEIPPMPPEWEDPEYRQAAMEANVENLIAWSIRINREERGLTQAELAARMGTKQSAVSKLEDPEGGDVQVSTLMKAAHALDLALLVRFVDYSEFAAQTRDVRPERLFACQYEDAKNLVSTKFAARPERLNR